MSKKLIIAQLIIVPLIVMLVLILFNRSQRNSLPVNQDNSLSLEGLGFMETMALNAALGRFQELETKVSDLEKRIEDLESQISR